MANLYIREYQGLGNTGMSDSVEVAAEDGQAIDQVVAAPTAAVASNPFNTKTRWVALCADATCSFVFSPVATPVAATVTSFRLPANTVRLFRIPDVIAPPNGKAPATWQVSAIPNN